jgi:hypothetical protein
MILSGSSTLNRVVKEPPLRLLVKFLVRAVPVPIRIKADWDAVPRPPYLVGVLQAADQAAIQGIREISAIEFGVGGGEGLVALQEVSEAVERETGVRIAVYGFDTGKGLPDTAGNPRDHPDRWRLGDFPMDYAALSRRLTDRTKLILGDVADTVPAFIRKTEHPPIGFISVDLDLHSSTSHALRVFTLPDSPMLLHVPMYFDDIAQFQNHKFGGELLAIDEFNALSSKVKIDRWRGIADHRAFPENAWLGRMYVAHDIDGIARLPRPDRAPLRLRGSLHG